MAKIKGVKFKCNICGEEHEEYVDQQQFVEWIKKSPTPIFTCPQCGEDGLSHINNVHLKVLAKYIDLLNTLWEAIEEEREKLSRHGVWIEFIEECEPSQK